MCFIRPALLSHSSRHASGTTRSISSGIPMVILAIQKMTMKIQYFHRSFSMADNRSSTHILSISATLFGFCYVVLTSLKAMKIDGQTIIDECTAVSLVLFMASCLLSFLSIRNKTPDRYEKWAEYIFLAGLLTLFTTTLFIVLHIII